MTHYTPTLALRAQPDAGWISDIRRRYPVERAIDEVFTRKLQNRSLSADHRTDFAQLQQRLHGFLQRETGQQDIRIDHLRRLSGGASKEQFTFDLSWQPQPGQRSIDRLMLRMDPAESIVETHRLRECQVLRAVWGEVPVPEVLWIDPEGSALGHPALVARFLEGRVQPEKSDKMSGVGMYFEPALRDALKDQFVEILARIHHIDWRQKDLSTFDVPAPGTLDANQRSLGLWERAWQEDTLEAHPVMARAALWLKENMPTVECPVLVHGDYRSGNFMFTPAGRINAIFDWELAYLGDHHDDLAWASLSVFGGADERGRPLASSLMSLEEFIDSYQRHSGFSVDRRRLFYFQVFSFYKIAVIAAATSLRVAHSRKTHLDAMMNLASGIGYVGISELNRMLEIA
jgi:aminoglycoside phosphotransferase (APT) family kinase protein